MLKVVLEIEFEKTCFFLIKLVSTFGIRMASNFPADFEEPIDALDELEPNFSFWRPMKVNCMVWFRREVSINKFWPEILRSWCWDSALRLRRKNFNHPPPDKKIGQSKVLNPTQGSKVVTWLKTKD